MSMVSRPDGRPEEPPDTAAGPVHGRPGHGSGDITAHGSDGATASTSVSTSTPAAAPDSRHRLTALQGLAALSLDAMASVAYGPESIVLVLAAAGGYGLGFTLPVTLAIAALLAVLIASYRQVIAAYPDGGGSYAVARTHLGRRTSLVAAASLLLDHVLNVAVSVTAGVAALTSAFPDRQAAEALRRDWELWNPGVELLELPSANRSIGGPVAAYVTDLTARRQAPASPS